MNINTAIGYIMNGIVMSVFLVCVTKCEMHTRNKNTELYKMDRIHKHNMELKGFSIKDNTENTND